MKRCAIGLAILALLATDVAQAQLGGPAARREGRWEFTLKTAYTWAEDLKGEYGSSVELEDDLGWGFGFGYNVSNQINLGLSFSWRSMSYYATIVDAEHLEDTSSYSNWLDVGTMAVTGEYCFLRSRFTPYASGALGWTTLDTNIIADTSYGCWWDPWWGYVCSDYSSTYGSDAVSWSLGAGMRFELSPAVFLRIGYEHGWVDVDTFDGSDMLRMDLGLLN